MKILSVIHRQIQHLITDLSVMIFVHHSMTDLTILYQQLVKVNYDRFYCEGGDTIPILSFDMSLKQKFDVFKIFYMAYQIITIYFFLSFYFYVSTHYLNEIDWILKC